MSLLPMQEKRRRRGRPACPPPLFRLPLMSTDSPCCDGIWREEEPSEMVERGVARVSGYGQRAWDIMATPAIRQGRQFEDLTCFGRRSTLPPQ